MLLEQLEAKNDFTNSEAQIAEYLLTHPFELEHLTVAQLAECTYTSKATVTRLCRKLGCESYREFQQTLGREQTVRQQIDARLNTEPISADTTYEDIQRILPALYESAVYGALLKMEKTTVERAVRKIRLAKKVETYGSGVTYSIAQLFAFKLATLGVECSVYSGLNEHAILADKHPEEKVVVMFSLTGGNPTMCNVAQWLRKRNYYILGIGGEVKHGLKDLCSDYISVPMEKNILGMEIMKAFNGVNYAADVLFTMLLVRDYDYNRAVAVQLLSGENEDAEAAE